LQIIKKKKILKKSINNSLNNLYKKINIIKKKNRNYLKGKSIKNMKKKNNQSNKNKLKRNNNNTNIHKIIASYKVLVKNRTSK